MTKSIVTIRLDQEVISELDSLAGECRISRSSLLNKVVCHFLESNKLDQNLSIGRKGRGQ